MTPKIGKHAADDPRRDAWFMIPLLASAMMLLASTAFAAGEETPVQGPGADASPTAEAPGAEAPGAEAGEDCLATGETVDGMPATKHQEQVLKDVDEADAEELQAMEPAAGCPDTGDMPATQHQQDVLDGEQAPEAAQ